MNRIDHRYKIIVLGESNVGKTALLRKYKSDVFDDSLMSTIGIDTVTKTIVVKNKTVCLQIWDTAGQERFFSLTRSYYRNADAILLVFDLSCNNTFITVDRWYKTINNENKTSKNETSKYEYKTSKNETSKNKTSKNENKTIKNEDCIVPIFLIGNKKDLITDIQYKHMEEDIKKKAKDIQAKYYCTSAKNGYNVNKIFEDIGTVLVRNSRSVQDKHTTNVVLPRNKKRGCC